MQSALNPDETHQIQLVSWHFIFSSNLSIHALPAGFPETVI